jgi:hypothetical protein
MPRSSANSRDKENQQPRPKLSKEARGLLTQRQRRNAAAYGEDIAGAWGTLDEAIVKIAATHKKSVRSVRTALHMGRSALTRQRPTKTSPWNAYIWKVKQNQGPSGND